jgi:hypothetical protein
MDAPRHSQLMDPAQDPEELIASSIYYHPLIFPTRTEVLDHLFLVNGNGYEWNDDGQLRSVFAHIDPRKDFPDRYEDDIMFARMKGDTWRADYECRELAKLLAIRAWYQTRARTYGPVRLTYHGPDGITARTITSRDLPWTLLGRAPKNVHPAWRPVLEEARTLFADLLTEQGTLW